MCFRRAGQALCTIFAPHSLASSHPLGLIHQPVSLRSLQTALQCLGFPEQVSNNSNSRTVTNLTSSPHCSLQFFSRPYSGSSAASAVSAVSQHNGETEVLLPSPTPPLSSTAENSIPGQYQRIGKLQEKYYVPAKRQFAVVEVGPTQFKVTPDDVIVTEKLKDVDVNDKIALQRVMLLGSQHQTVVGRPFVPGAYVTAAVEEQFQDGKVIIFKKRRRKSSRRTKGHRQQLTTLRILDIHQTVQDQA